MAHNGYYTVHSTHILQSNLPPLMNKVLFVCIVSRWSWNFSGLTWNGQLLINCIWDWGFWGTVFFLGRFWTQSHFVWGERSNIRTKANFISNYECLKLSIITWNWYACTRSIFVRFKVELRYIYLSRVSCQVISWHQVVDYCCFEIILFYIPVNKLYTAIPINPNWNMM